MSKGALRTLQSPLVSSSSLKRKMYTDLLTVKLAVVWRCGVAIRLGLRGTSAAAARDD
jgi:hypothetical protein